MISNEPVRNPTGHYTRPTASSRTMFINKYDQSCPLNGTTDRHCCICGNFGQVNVA